MTETEMEMEIGNGNGNWKWNWKLEMELETGNGRQIHATTRSISGTCTEYSEASSSSSGPPSI